MHCATAAPCHATFCHAHTLCLLVAGSATPITHALPAWGFVHFGRREAVHCATCLGFIRHYITCSWTCWHWMDYRFYSATHYLPHTLPPPLTPPDLYYNTALLFPQPITHHFNIPFYHIPVLTIIIQYPVAMVTTMGCVRTGTVPDIGRRWFTFACLNNCTACGAAPCCHFQPGPFTYHWYYGFFRGFTVYTVALAVVTLDSVPYYPPVRLTPERNCVPCAWTAGSSASMYHLAAPMKPPRRVAAIPVA